MSKAIYVTYLMEHKEFRWQLSPEERQDFGRRLRSHLDELGAEVVVHCDARWATGFSGMRWEIHKDIDSWQRHAEFLDQIGFFRYFDVKMFIGTKFDGTTRTPDEKSTEVLRRYRSHFE